MAGRERPSEDRVGALIENSLRVAIPIRNKLADLMLIHLWHVCPTCEQPLVSGARFCNSCGQPTSIFATTQPRQPITQPSAPPIQLRYQCDSCVTGDTIIAGNFSPISQVKEDSVCINHQPTNAFARRTQPSN